MECIICPNGFKCDQGFPERCALGQHSFNGECRDCTSGKYCPIGASSELSCPVGYFCPALSYKPTRCPAGRFGTQIDRVDFTQCDLCGPGYFCDGVRKVICPRGHYCDNSAELPKKCPAGSYNTELGNSASSCTGCPAGYYCPTGQSFYPDLCPAGYYCPLASDRQVCPAGTYSEREGNSVVSDCQNCPKGHFCPAGSSSPYPCPAGTYQPNERQPNCADCPTGKSCSTISLVEPDLLCDQGHFCPQGSSYPNSWAANIEWNSFSISFNQNSATGCLQGQMTQLVNGTAAGACEVCPAGYYCFPKTGNALINPIECPAGYYCDQYAGAVSSGDITYSDGNTNAIGTVSPNGGTPERGPKHCLAGTWSNQTRLSTHEDCWSCEKGWKCDFGTNQLNKGSLS